MASGLTDHVWSITELSSRIGEIMTIDQLTDLAWEVADELEPAVALMFST